VLTSDGPVAGSRAAPEPVSSRTIGLFTPAVPAEELDSGVHFKTRPAVRSVAVDLPMSAPVAGRPDADA